MTAEERTRLVRLVNGIADDLDSNGYPYTGPLRQLARVVATTAVVRDEAGCVGCGTPLEQPERGRRRVWCSDQCRDAARRR